MLFLKVIQVAIRSLAANKLRSILAMLGIIIGVGAVISMLALGAGAERQVMDQISAMGTNLLIVRAGQRGMGGVNTTEQQTLTIQDAEAIVAMRGVFQVAPVVNGSAQMKYLNKNSRSTVVGTTSTYFSLRNFTIARGRSFTELEAERNAKVAVIGQTTADNLFGAQDPIGQSLKMNGASFLVIGLLTAKGDQGWFNPDDQALVPYTTAMKQVLGLTSLREIDIQAEKGTSLEKLQERLTELLRSRHRTQPGVPEDFSVRNQAEILATATTVGRTFTVLLGGVACISLLVGGIGIMNIMLVTVTERTREIGIRKAIGAKRRDILGQFLLEAVFMSCCGGALGVVFGMSTAQLITALSPFSAIIEASSVLLSVGSAAAVGIFFGYYPAYKASLLNPIEALRYE